MTQIIIKSMRLTNFKGVRDLQIDFSDSVTNIFGRNGSGKTTIFDAFTWLLFGKNSNDEQKFDLKTLDEDGRIIPNIPHEVSAVLEVDGKEVRLTRRFTEKWVKRAGKVDREFDGNKEERFFNDVPCGKGEYEAHIAEICREDIFKFITSPTYFCSQKDVAQKAMLQEMAGDITDKEVAADNEDFIALLDAITEKSLTDYKKEINAKKTRINTELVDLPGRIDEKKRDIAKAEAEAEDWSSLEAELQQKREARAEIEKQLDSISAAQRAQSDKRKAIEAEIHRLQREVMQRTSEVNEEALKAYYEAVNARNEMKHRESNLQQQITRLSCDIDRYQREVDLCTDRRLQLLSKYNALLEKREAINAEQLQIDEAQFVCPTCHRPLDVTDIEEKEAQMLQNFETERGKRLERVKEDIENNMRDGRINNERKQQFIDKIEEAHTDIDVLRAQLAEISRTYDFNAPIEKPDTSSAIASDDTLKTLKAAIEVQTALFDEESASQTEDTTELKDGRTMLTAAIEELVARLAKRTDIKALRDRQNEIETQMQMLNVELAELERQEFVIAEFSKARSAAIEARINGLFELVRFRWIKVAINGAESETCEATINGVPYASLNHAGQILAGLDIINAICKSKGIFAPIFIDNAESINDITKIQMQSQFINLIVSEDAQLRIEAVNK